MNIGKYMIQALFAAILLSPGIILSADNNSTVNIVHPIDQTKYPHPDPQSVNVYMQTFSFGATCKYEGEVNYVLEQTSGGVILNNTYRFYGHTSKQFGYKLEPGEYTFTVNLVGETCKPTVSSVIFHIAG